MLTSILKNKTRSKHRQQMPTKWETYRDKDTLLRFEDPNAQNNHVFEQISNNKNREHFLPSIYKTENLIPHTNKSKMSIVEFSNEKKMYKLSIPKLNRLTFIKESSPEKQNVRARALTDERENSTQCKQPRIYHNFVNKKKNKKNNHMSKIIDKVISENIEPWELSNSSVLIQGGQKNKESKKLIRGQLQNYCWQKYVLSDLNSMLDRR